MSSWLKPARNATTSYPVSIEQYRKKDEARYITMTMESKTVYTHLHCAAAGRRNNRSTATSRFYWSN